MMDLIKRFLIKSIILWTLMFPKAMEKYGKLLYKFLSISSIFH